MTLQNTVKDAVKEAIGITIGKEIQEIVAKETRRALRDREQDLTALVRTAVTSAIAELFNGAASPSAG